MLDAGQAADPASRGVELDNGCQFRSREFKSAELRAAECVADGSPERWIVDRDHRIEGCDLDVAHQLGSGRSEPDQITAGNEVVHFDRLAEEGVRPAVAEQVIVVLITGEDVVAVAAADRVAVGVRRARMRLTRVGCGEFDREVAVAVRGGTVW